MEKNLCFTKSLTFQLEITARIFYNLAKEFFKQDLKNKISLEEFVILETIVCYPHLDINGISRTLIRDKASIEKIISKLIKKKLIFKVKEDNCQLQVKYFELTSAGDKIYNESIPKYDKMISILAKFISENELASFTKTLLKIRNILISLGYIS